MVDLATGDPGFVIKILEIVQGRNSQEFALILKTDAKRILEQAAELVIQKVHEFHYHKRTPCGKNKWARQFSFTLQAVVHPDKHCQSEHGYLPQTRQTRGNLLPYFASRNLEILVNVVVHKQVFSSPRTSRRGYDSCSEVATWDENSQQWCRKSQVGWCLTSSSMLLYVESIWLTLFGIAASPLSIIGRKPKLLEKLSRSGSICGGENRVN
eukprot:g43219.t1